MSGNAVRQEHDRIDDLEERLRAAIDELGRASDRASRAERALSVLGERLAHLEREAREGGSFLCSLAHEIRNPLAPIRSASYLVRKNPSEPEAVLRADAMIERQVTRLASMANDLSDLGRARRGDLSLRFERVDVKLAVTKAIEEARPVVFPRRQSVTVRSFSDGRAVQGDFDQLVRIFRSLAIGAASSAPDGEEIVVEIRTVGDRVSVTVPGIEHSAERPHGEHGTALALTRELVLLHSGTFSARVGEGGGISISLPLSPELFDAGGLPAEAARPADRGEERARRAGLPVLIIEDNRDSAEALANCLGVSGYEVHVAFDSAHGLRLAEEKRPAVVVCDIGLPEMDGYEVARILRRSPATARSTLIALTGYGLEEDRDLSLKAGFDHHLIKPIGIEDLEALMARVTKQAAAG